MASESSQSIQSTADLARYLNVSQWTVSRAINGHKDVSEETRKRVFEAMEECGFEPNLHARKLRGQTSKLIGVCFRNFSIPIINVKLAELQRVLRTYGFHYLFETTMGEADREVSVIKDFQRFGVDGIININSVLKEKKLEEHLGTTPCVLLESAEENTGKIVHVTLDRSQAMRDIIQHLFRLGHRRFAMIGIGKGNRWRWAPVESMVKELGLDPAKALWATPEFKEMDNYLRGGRMLVDQFLGLPESERPRALVCLDDLIAVGAIQALLRKGFRIPEDFSVTGFNNEEISRELYPTITTIDQSPHILMKRSCELLMDLISGQPSSGLPEMIKPELLVRESTGQVINQKN